LGERAAFFFFFFLALSSFLVLFQCLVQLLCVVQEGLWMAGWLAVPALGAPQLDTVGPLSASVSELVVALSELHEDRGLCLSPPYPNSQTTA
jgi:hypothetical protein